MSKAYQERTPARAMAITMLELSFVHFHFGGRFVGAPFAQRKFQFDTRRI